MASLALACLATFYYSLFAFILHVTSRACDLYCIMSTLRLQHAGDV